MSSILILLHQTKLLFLKPKKVAGTSFEIALSKFADDLSVITPITEDDEMIRKNLGFCGPQNFHLSPLEVLKTGKLGIWKELLQSRKPMKYWNHISAKLAREGLGEAQWTQACKVSIVRNPFDMAVSRYFWSKRPTEYSSKDFESFCVALGNGFKENTDQYFIGDTEIIDFYIKYETIHDDILRLEEKFSELKGMGDIFSSINAKGQYRPRNASTGDIFSKAPLAKQIISDVCRFEIEKFGYQCP